MPDPSNVQFRALRRATGLLQEDIAHLLGLKDSSSVSRFERQQRDPDVRTAFACEYILGAHASSLFSNIFGEVTKVISKRARQRLNSLSMYSNDTRHADRLTHLSRLVEKPRTLFDV